MNKLEKIQKKIAEAIKYSGMTQEELAKKIGVQRPQISKYIHGVIMPSYETFAKLCAVLDLDANEVLCVDDFKSLE